MALYLLDTNHASPLVTPSNLLQGKFLYALNAGHNFAICVPVLTELLFGIGMTPRAKQNFAEWKQLATRLQCFCPEEAEAELAAEMQISLRRRGWQLGTVDALIAAVAIRNKCILLTTDGDFDEVPGLNLENWIR